MQLLVDHRETLKLGDIVPVGDLYDVVAHGDEAFSQEMAIHFENAKRLYHQKLLPAIEKQHGRKDELDKLPFDDPRRTAFRNDDRLVKTLLLSALVPQVESLRSLTADRLAALNHGTIRTPIPGKEGQEVLRRCKSWAASVGEVKIGEEVNPTISIQLSGVDTESIISQASGEDRHGNRVQRVRQMLYEQAKIEREGEFEQSYELTWKNTRRTCVVIFRNIRELADSSLENDGGDWKLVIDFPFDEPGHGPRDDLGRIQAFKHSHPKGAKTICWVPAFFSDEARKDLGLLVTLEHILTGERYGQYSGHLSPQDRQAAKALLENQRSVLRQRVQSHLDAAYGLDPLLPGSIDTVHDLEPAERFVSLQDGFEPRPPVAASLAGAMNHLVCQALDHEFPAAPDFEAEVKSSHLKKVFEIVSPAATAADERAPVDKSLRALVRGIANPLKLGDMKLDATHFVIGQHWKNHFTRKAAEAGLTATTGVEVRQLRKWINEPKPMGLPREAENLVILVYALQTSQSFFIHGAPFTEPNLSNLLDGCIVKPVVLPPEPEWSAAIDRAGSILGLAISPLLNASNVAALTSGAKKRAGELRAACQSYCQRLRDRLDKQHLPLEGTDRLETAIAALQLVEKLNATPESAIVAALAAARIATSESAMGECLAKAASLAATIDGTNWEIFEAIGRLTDNRAATASKILGVVEQVLRCDEHVQPLAATLKDAQSKAVRLLAPPPTTPPPTTPSPETGWRVVDHGNGEFESVADARVELDQLSGKLTGDGRRIVVTMSWRIEEKKR